MKQITVKKGKIILENVPKPIAPAGTVLVRVAYSCISQGTEIAGIQSCGKGKIEKAIEIIKEKPLAIKKAVDLYKKEGASAVFSKFNAASGTDTTAKPIGYSISGLVEEVGEGVTDIITGDKVACAGAGIANHAEYVVVPRNLMMKMPDSLDLQHASTVTLGGIAMQGVRRGSFQLGEFVAVFGLGFLGLLTVEMLKSSGCRVIAIDVDNRRCDIAKKHGAEKTFNPNDHDNIANETIKLTNGYGVDGVIFTAATDNPEVISSAFKMCKRKGKVVLVGVAGNKINRQDLYEKELDFLISTSYGPGRYDNNYEIKGIDYPYAYVRWTENRNMEEYLRLVATKNVVIDDLIEKIYAITEAENAYNELQTTKNKPIVALFEYPELKTEHSKTIELERVVQLNRNIINVAIIGAGGFAKSTHLPNLEKLKKRYNIYAICDINALNATETAKQFNANIATTDFNEILHDSNTDLVMICTRHNLHAEYAIKALKAGKAVFVEKPMATNNEYLDELVKVIRETKLPYMVGFNRRFSPFIKEIRNKIQERTNPVIISYRMNAGYIPPDSWVHEDGGRIIGEACHIIDLFTYLIDANIESYYVDKITPATEAFSSIDNISLNIRYKDGSLANLIYTALGNPGYPKENMELYCDNNVYRMTDYQTLEIFGNSILKKELKKTDKGHLQELIEFYDSLSGKNESLAIPLDDMIQTTRLTLLI